MEQPEQVVYVDNEPFLGRRREQDLFRDMLDAILAPREDDAPPFIILIHGVGGIGKSQLNPPPARPRSLLDHLGRALDQKSTPQQVSSLCDWARRDPDLPSLHGDPRFEALVGGE
jgi:hypothetical protein